MDNTGAYNGKNDNEKGTARNSATIDSFQFLLSFFCVTIWDHQAGREEKGLAGERLKNLQKEKVLQYDDEKDEDAQIHS